MNPLSTQLCGCIFQNSSIGILADRLSNIIFSDTVLFIEETVDVAVAIEWFES